LIAVALLATVLLAVPAARADVEQIKVFFVRIGDQGKTGKPVGCGDSVVPVLHAIAPTKAPLRPALEALLAIRDAGMCDSDLYTALGNSRLVVERVTMDAGRATVFLRGELRSGGVCDNPRIKAQLEETIRQFSTVKETAIFVNGIPLDTALSEKG